MSAAIPSVVGEDHDEFVRTAEGWLFGTPHEPATPTAPRLRGLSPSVLDEPFLPDAQSSIRQFHGRPSTEHRGLRPAAAPVADEIAPNGNAVPAVDHRPDRPSPVVESIVEVGIESADAVVSVVAVADPHPRHAPHPDLNVSFVEQQQYLDVAASHRGEGSLHLEIDQSPPQGRARLRPARSPAAKRASAGCGRASGRTRRGLVPPVEEWRVPETSPAEYPRRTPRVYRRV